MKKNIWVWIVSAAVIGAGFVIGNVLGNKKEPMRRRPGAVQKKEVKIITVKNKDITIPVEMSGPLAAFDKVEVYAEVSGILLNNSRRFKEGSSFKKGEVLVHIDDRVYENNVLAQKSAFLNQLTLLIPDLSIDFPKSSPAWETYLEKMDIHEALPPLPETSGNKERYYIASRNIFNQYYVIKGMETTLSKYTIRAPFSGVVTQSTINPGTLVRVGQKLGEFISTDVYEMEASLGLFLANRLRVGSDVDLTSEDIQGVFTGRIVRINRVLDPASLTVKVYIHASDPRLRDGMYMVARTDAEPVNRAIIIPRDLLVRDDILYAVEKGVLVKKPVQVIARTGDQVILRGLADGTRILGEVWPEAREGLPVPTGGGKGPGKTAGQKDPGDES